MTDLGTLLAAKCKCCDYISAWTFRCHACNEHPEGIFDTEQGATTALVAHNESVHGIDCTP